MEHYSPQEYALQQDQIFHSLPGIVAHFVHQANTLLDDLNFQVSDNDNGLSEVTITVQDDGGTTVDYLNNQHYEVGVDESEPQIFYIKVLPVNDPPSYEVGTPRILDEDSGLITYENWINESRRYGLFSSYFFCEGRFSSFFIFIR